MIAKRIVWCVLVTAWAVFTGALPAAATADASVESGGADALPLRLSDTGLFVPGSTSVRAQNLSFSPQYPLWSDGATKRRWLFLPPGTAIDARVPDAWEFPPGTRLWKEFGHARAVETRVIERMQDGSWRFAAYIWNASGSDALLAPAEGVARLPAEGAPRGFYTIPSREDCRACHEGGAVPVLGLGALQLSSYRDPLAPHAETLQPGQVGLLELAAYGLLRNVPQPLLNEPPIIQSATPAGRAALGYLHANCGHCHNASGPLAWMELDLAQSTSALTSAMPPALRSTVNRPSDSRALGLDRRVVPGHPERSLLAARMGSRDPFLQMPPLGTHVVDAQGLAVVEQWIRELKVPQE